MENATGLAAILQSVPDWIWIGLSASGIAAWVSTFLKSKHSNTFIQLLADTLNVIGGNIFRGKNADDDRL